MEDNVMWEKQKQFQQSINSTAKELFNKVNPELKPEVFLLGVLMDEGDDKQTICLVPEGCGYSVSDFSGLNQLTLGLKNVDPEHDRQFYHLNPRDNQKAQSRHDENLENRAYIEAIKKILSKKNFYNCETEQYISYYPNKINNNWRVFIVLKLQKKAVNKHYYLIDERKKTFDKFKIHSSFIESVIDVYLDECSKALNENNYSFLAIKRNCNELIREAGDQFMLTVAGLCTKDNHRLNYYLCDALNIISSLKYEGEEGLGKMAIAEEKHPNIKYTLQLKERIKIDEFRKVRKFLQLAKEDSLIISDAAFIYGLGEIRGKYNPRDESLFIINFISHYKWEVLHDNQSMMIVEYEQPRLPKESIDRDKFYSDLRRIFKDIEDTQLSDLWDITIEATKQKHGTMLVITDKAKEESERLGKQCFPLTPLRLNTSIVQQITSIDGSVLIDRYATCYAVGVILDGNATDKGDASRGARYNSAIRYYEQQGKNNSTVLVIISEDGMIDLIPKLDE